MLELHAPMIEDTPLPPIRFVSTLRGKDLWPKSHTKIDAKASPIAAVHVLAARHKLGLEQFSDMHDIGDNRTMIDIEKLLRMALHQSVLAFEILVGPGFGKLERQFIIENAFTKTLVEHLDLELEKAEKSWKRSKGAMAADHFSLLLMRAGISKNIAASDVSTILEKADLPAFDPLRVKKFNPKENFDLFKKLSKETRMQPTKLPKKPKGYDALNDFLVELRFE